MAAAADLRVQHRDGAGPAGERQVALVGRDDHAALARPVDHLAQVLRRQHPPGRVRRRVDPDQRDPPWAQRGQRVGPHPLRARQPGADLVGRVGQLGDRRLCASGPRPEQRRQPGDELLGPDRRQDRHWVDDDAEPPLQRPGHGLAQRLGRCRGSSGSRARRRRARTARRGPRPGRGRPACRPRGRRSRRGARGDRASAARESHGKSAARRRVPEITVDGGPGTSGPAAQCSCSTGGRSLIHCGSR